MLCKNRYRMLIAGTIALGIWTVLQFGLSRTKPMHVKPVSQLKQTDNIGDWEPDYQSINIINGRPKRKTLNVAYYFSLLPVVETGGIFEFDWISNILLGELERPVRVITGEQARRHPRNDTLHVFLFEPDKNLFTNRKDGGLVNQGAFHMGDELMDKDISYYPNAAYVFRNYYNGEYLERFSNVHFAPLGTKSGFGRLPASALLPVAQRRYLANFIGSLRANRQEMVDVIREYRIQCVLSYEHPWGSKEGLHPIDYRNVLRESIFTFAPWGNNPESLRLYEALEAGSIPVYQRPANPNLNPMNAMGDDHPIPQFSSWQKAAKFIISMRKNLTALNNLQVRLINFWSKYKNATQQKFKHVVDAAFRDSHGFEC